MKTKKGPKDDLRKEYFTDGKPSTAGRYANGKRTGPWKFHLKNGRLRAAGKPLQIGKFKDGLLSLPRRGAKLSLMGYPLYRMNRPSAPVRERRRYCRRALAKVRVRLVSGEFDDLAGSVNFARRLVNVSQAGACVETTGRLRPDVKMTIEIRFEEFGGTLRSQAQVIWADTVKEGAAETHLLGLRFVGLELTNAVRDFFEGDRASMIVSKRRAEYEELKLESTARKANLAGNRWSATRKSFVFPLLLVLLYVGSFGGFLAAGRTESAGPGIRFRYLGGPAAAEETLAKIYSPLVWAARKAGLELTYEPVRAPKP